jgi:hypothetical protein
MESTNNNYKKKQNLIAKYYQKIKELEQERKKINAQLKITNEKFEELITSEANEDQLNLFEDMDQLYLDK